MVGTETSVTHLRSVAAGHRPPASMKLGDFVEADIPFGPSLRRADLLRAAQAWMSKHHRNERLYKALVAKKLLKGRYSLRTSALLTEFRIGASIVDCIVVNGHGHAYEIKTELDSPQKLQKQLADYRRAFRYVTVITHDSLAGRYADLLGGTPTGLLALSPRGALSPRLTATAWADDLHIPTMFAALRQAEYRSIHRNITGEMPQFRPVDEYKACLEQAQMVDAAQYSTLFEEQLRARRALLPDILAEETFEPVLPQCATINPTPLQAARIREWLESEVD